MNLVVVLAFGVFCVEPGPVPMEVTWEVPVEVTMPEPEWPVEASVVVPEPTEVIHDPMANPSLLFFRDGVGVSVFAIRDDGSIEIR